MVPLDTTQALINSYTEQGISLDKVLKDPLFEQMTVPQKTLAIRKYGEKIKAGVKFDKEEVSSLLKTVATELGAAALITAKFLLPAKRVYDFYKPSSDIPASISAVTPDGQTLHRNLNQEYAERTTNLALGIPDLATAAMGYGTYHYGKSLVDNTKLRNIVKKTDFANMSEEDAVKFLARVSMNNGGRS